MKQGLLMVRALLAAMIVCAAFAGQARAYVYWANAGPGIANDGTTIGRANQDASGVTHSFITGLSGPGGVTVDASHIYWADTQTNSIGRANLDGSGANRNFIPGAADSSAGGGQIPVDIATDASFIYWTDGNKYVGRATLAGGAVTPHFINAGSSPQGIAVSAGKIYIGEADSILYVPATGGMPPSLLKVLSATPTAIAVANNFIYMAELNPGASSIGRMQTNGSGLDESFVPNLAFPTGVATDGTYVYWADHGGAQNTIGRALLGTSGATNVLPSFVSEPGGPAGVVVDSLIDPTTTTVNCIPPSVTPGSPSSCTATVGDSASTAPPTGPVVFSGSATTFFSGSSSSCTLAVHPGGSVSCTIGVVPTLAGTTSVHAAYSGDAVHSASATDFEVCVGTAAQCGAPTPPSPSPSPKPKPTPKPSCVVPRLKGKSLAAARTLLSKSHCALGKVKRPHVRKGHKLGKLVVGSESPQAGGKLSAGSKVAVVLVKAPKPRRRR
jgi:hypothetical protein